MEIVWIASYPKSGNTWVRFLLANYFLGEVASSREVARCIPDLHVKGQFPPAEPWLTPARGRLLVKTHLAFSPTHPAAESTAGFIYILRNPKDVLLSSLNHRRLEGQSITKVVGAFSDEQYARGFISAGGDPVWRRMGFGSWEEHTASWLTRTSVPQVRLRYRDLRTQAVASLRAMLELLGEPVDEARAQAAIENSSFERLRAMEIREREAGESSGVFVGDRATMRKGIFFLNKGRMGASLEGIAPGLDKQFDHRFADPTRTLGLEFGPGGPGGGVSATCSPIG